MNGLYLDPDSTNCNLSFNMSILILDSVLTCYYLFASRECVLVSLVPQLTVLAGQALVRSYGI